MKRQVLNTNVTQGNLDSHLPAIIKLAKSRTSSYVCLVNVHMAIEAYKDKSFCEVVNNADFAFPDGMPIVKQLNTRYKNKQERIAGMDLFPRLLKEANAHSLRVGFIGSTDEVLSQIKTKVNKNHPNVEITATISPPFGKPWDNQSYVETFNRLNTEFVFVALGCPAQEKWMHQQKGQLHAIMFGVGGAFPVFVGEVKRAPKWMQDNSLEWFHRFIKEPRRLFKRYLYTNTKFLLLAAKEKIRDKPIERNETQ